MELSAAEMKNKKTFDGRLREQSADNLLEFSEKNYLTNFSQTLAEFLMLVEWRNEKKTPEIDDFAIYNSLLRLEKTATTASSWELVGKDDDGPLISLSTFEMNMLEQTLSMFLQDMLDTNLDQNLFFPLSDLYHSEVIVKWRILEKIASVKVTPQPMIYKQKLTEYVKMKIQREAGSWLKEKLSNLKLSGQSTVLKDTEHLIAILKDLLSHVNAEVDVITTEETLFIETSCSFFDSFLKVINETLYPVCLQIMKAMDVYQERHRSFHVNLRDSCALSHSLFRHIKKLIQSLQSLTNRSESFISLDYNAMFVKFFMNLLQVIKSECHGRIERAASTEEKDSIQNEEKILSSSVIVLNCICTVIDEWKHLEIEDEDMQIAFLIRITDIICDGAKLYSEVLDQRLSKLNEQQTDIFQKICIIANSIDHVRSYLMDMPQQMQWDQSAQMVQNEDQVSEQIIRILRLIHQSMDAQLRFRTDKLLKSSATKIQSQCEKALNGWLQGNNLNQGYDRFMTMLNEHLESVHLHLKEKIFSKFLSLMWSSILMYIQNDFREGQPPEYAITLKENVYNLEEYFIYLKMDDPQSCHPILQQIYSNLELNSKTTVDLQLDYYSCVAESIVSPVEYLGHIAFQAGYKTINDDVVELYIKVQKGQRLPARKFEMDELYVKLELFPSSLFPYQVPIKSAAVRDDLENPLFNQVFQFPSLSQNVFNVKGAVVQVLVMNQDKSYSAEAVLLLNQVQNMSGFTSLDFLPVYLMPLKKFDMSQISYQVLANRSRWDKSAKTFINSRNKVDKNQKKFLSCIPRKNMCLT